MMASLKLFLSFCCLAWALQVAISQVCQPFAFISPSTVVQFGDQVQLDCSYDGAASVGVSWTKDPQQSIDADSSLCHCAVTLYNSGTGSSLFINVTDGGDLGSYTCTAVFGFGDTCPATVQVLRAATVLTLIPVGGDGVFIRWNMVLGITSYSINGTTVPCQTSLCNTTIATTVPCQTSLCNTTIDGLVAGMTYTFVLSYGGQSVSSSITVGSGLNPTTINKVSQFGASQFGMVSWSAVTGASGYLVYINKDTPLAYIVNVTTGTFTNITSICAMANITVQVQAYTLSAFSKLSPLATLLTSCAPVVKPVGQTSIFVEWTASGDISSYNIVYQITLGSSPAMTAGPISCSGRCNYTLTGLTPEAVYTVTVVGVGGQQPVTSALQASVGSGLSAVTGVMVTSTMGYANLWWNEVPNANGYLVYVNQTTTATSSIINVTTGVKVTIPISCGQPYTFGVQAYNNVGYSDVSPLTPASCELFAPSRREYALAAITVVLIPVVVMVMLIFVWRRISSRNASREMRNFVDSASNCQSTLDIPLHSNLVYTSSHGMQPSSTVIYDVIGTPDMQPDYYNQAVQPEVCLNGLVPTNPNPSYISAGEDSEPLPNRNSYLQMVPDIPLHSNTSSHGMQPSSTVVYDVIDIAAIHPDYYNQAVQPEVRLNGLVPSNPNPSYISAGEVSEPLPNRNHDYLQIIPDIPLHSSTTSHGTPDIHPDYYNQAIQPEVHGSHMTSCDNGLHVVPTNPNPSYISAGEVNEPFPNS